MTEAKWYNRVVYLFIVSSIAWSSYTEVAAADDIAENNVRSSKNGVGKWLWGGRRRATGWFPGIGVGIGGSIGGGFGPGGVGGSTEEGIPGLGIGGGISGDISGIGGSGISGGFEGAGGGGAGTNKANCEHTGYVNGGGYGGQGGGGDWLL